MNSHKKRFQLINSSLPFFSAHRFREIAASAAGEVGQMDEIDFTNENSQTEHNNNFVKFRLFHVEKVECDRKC